MHRTAVKLAACVLVVALLLGSQREAQAQYYYQPAPVVSYYYTPTPVVSYYTPTVAYTPAVAHYYTPTVSYYTPAVSYYAPRVSYYAAPAVASPGAVSTTYYGLFGRPKSTSTYYYQPVVVYP